MYVDIQQSVDIIDACKQRFDIILADEDRTDKSRKFSKLQLQLEEQIRESNSIRKHCKQSMKFISQIHLPTMKLRFILI